MDYMPQNNEDIVSQDYIGMLKTIDKNFCKKETYLLDYNNNFKFFSRC